jgi:hypothetical protein
VITGHGKALPARLLLGALALLVALAAMAGGARADAGGRTVHYGGRTVEVPAGYKVIRIAPGSRTCQRLDRRVVYLGAASKNQACPAGPILGKRRAIVVAPGAKRSHVSARAAGPAAHASSAKATASESGSVFTGLGFDTCSAPSTKAMAAWAESPFRGVGIYIGGENSACSQPNLSASWVSAETTAGWHLIPTYVGLQATTSSCSSCAKMTAVAAATQGTAAAEDAVTEAAAIGIGTGSPIYFDMESYSPTTAATKAVLTFLSAWTTKLHALGYESGVYSSSGSGIVDLGDQVGSTTYTLPDDIWIADWNNVESTASTAVPESAWANHQRIHQFRGGHNDTYGGTTINIDSDDVDGATVGVGSPVVTADDPLGKLELSGSPSPGQLRIKGWTFDPDAPTEALSITAVVGGREGQKGVETYELGPIANLERTDVAATHKLAGPFHGFDTSFVTIKSGPEPVCVYAVNVALGGNRLLGCKTTTIPVAVTFPRVKAMPNGVKVTIACQFPAGTDCPGHLGLRARIKIATPRRHRAPRIHTVTRSLGSRTFHLSGAKWHTYFLPLSTGGLKLLRERGKLGTQLVAAIPGGRRGIGVPLEASGR